MNRLRVACWVALGCAVAALGQPPQPAPAPEAAPVAPSVRPDYILGPNDQILIRSNAEEINERPYRVDQDGFIVLPLVQRVQASGLTVAALERDLVERLRQYLVTPQVSITVTGFRNEPVSFLGAFVRPGFYPLTGSRSLVEMLSVAGGLQPNASRRLRITRRAENGPLPLPGAITDPATGASSAEIDINNLMQELNPIEDIELMAFDRVTAEQTQPIYASGEVNRPAAIDPGARESISVMQAITQAGGFTQNAKRKKIFVLRPVSGTSRLARIDINIDKIINGEENDFPLYANDILWVDRQSLFVTSLPVATTSIFSAIPFAVVSAIIR